MRNCHTLLYSFRVGARGEYGIYRTTSTRSAPLNAMSAIERAIYVIRAQAIGKGGKRNLRTHRPVGKAGVRGVD